MMRLPTQSIASAILVTGPGLDVSRHRAFPILNELGGGSASDETCLES